MLGPQVVIVILTLTTALFHWQLASEPDSDFRFWFVLNGIGYLALLAALYAPQTARYRHLVRWALAGYAALTIVVWMILAQPYDSADFPIKIIEGLLIVFLVLEDRQMQRQEG